MKQNIDTKGRLARGGLGLVFLLAGGVFVPQNWVLASLSGVCGLFTLFEAYRGWCGLRACGIKTPL